MEWMISIGLLAGADKLRLVGRRPFQTRSDSGTSVMCKSVKRKEHVS